MNTNIAIPVEHPIAIYTPSSLLVEGFESLDLDDCFAIVAYGKRYHDYGITDGSVLLCSKTLLPHENDLVLAIDDNVPTVYIYRPDSAVSFDGEKRILSDSKLIYATVICALNFYY